ncbi:TPA: DUF551 domain-containing protein [Citrobacter braakii]
MTALNKKALREAAQEEIMLRSVSDTSDAWQDEASPEAVLALLDELEAEPVAVNDDMAYSFHHALSDSSLGADEVEEIKIGLRAAFANIASPQPAPVVPEALLSAMEEVLRISDRDHEAWHKVRNGITSCRAAMLQAGKSPATPGYWVACSGRMSEGMQTVITSNGFDIGQGWWDGECWKSFDCHDVVPGKVTHWMPLPASPHFREIGNSSTNNFRENAETSTKCWCHTCRPVTMSDMRFVVCPECGNKRCPRANDHRSVCTGSNEPGQIGSAYPAAPQQEVK